MKPIVNLQELSLQSQTHGDFCGAYAPISDALGARQLGYNLTVIEPGKRVCPFHNHRLNEEMFLVLEGEGTLRFGEAEHPVRALDVIACPAGGREVAHQLVNTGTVPMKVLAVSTRLGADIIEYPDSDKVGVMSGNFPRMDLRQFFPASAQVDYFHGERGTSTEG